MEIGKKKLLVQNLPCLPRIIGGNRPTITMSTKESELIQQKSKVKTGAKGTSAGWPFWFQGDEKCFPLINIFLQREKQASDLTDRCANSIWDRWPPVQLIRAGSIGANISISIGVNIRNSNISKQQTSEQTTSHHLRSLAPCLADQSNLTPRKTDKNALLLAIAIWKVANQV